MINKIYLHGYIKRILFENNQIKKAIMSGTRKGKKDSVTITCFKNELMDYIQEGMELKMIGEVWDNNYQDKKGNWINSYTIAVNEIK